jgi:EAL domain-containing protein (putative c-di-GMP-specific phosphodiesterase class I)
MLIELARGLGLKTVAEGVESADVAAWLRRERIDMMQGYYFGKPSLERPWLAAKADEKTGGDTRFKLPTQFANGNVELPFGVSAV